MKIQQGQFSLNTRHESLQHLTQTDHVQMIVRQDGKEQVIRELNHSSTNTQVSISLYGTRAGETPDEPLYAGRLPGKNGIGNAFGPGFIQAPGQDRFDRTADDADDSKRDMSAALAKRFAADTPEASSGVASVMDDDMTLDAEAIEELRMLSFISMMEQMFGFKVSVSDGEALQRTEEQAEELRQAVGQVDRTPVQKDVGPTNGHQVVYESHIYYREEEYTHMSAEGKVITEDGRELELSLDLGMSRSFETESASEIVWGNLQDPLVINFDRPAVGLSDSLTFQFDLDADGHDETLPELLAGSGYLALDLNGDGEINSGKELFGAKSGDGFAELAQYDDDGNGFIDENDAVFSQLKVWVPKGDGEAELYALLDKDIGAIYLKSQQTPFALNASADNSNLGYVRESGVALKESGGLASVQQIDLRV